MKHVGAESGLSTLMMEVARYLRNVGTLNTVTSRNTITLILFNDTVRRTAIVLEGGEKVSRSADDGCDPADIHLRSSYLYEVTEKNWEKR
jgi:hypothetical protein